MKKVFAFIFALVILTASTHTLALASGGNAEEVPVLTSVTFKNAKIDGEFNGNTNSYSLILDDPDVSPIIASYEPEGLKVTAVYNYDETHHPTGITVTASRDNSIQYSTYFFSYSNLNTYQINSNNLISSISCDYCELSPQVNDKDTEYTLYVPSDLTTIELSVVAKDINAYCTYGGKISCTEGQELTIPITVTASNGEQRQYRVNVERLEKNIEQVKAEMADPDFKSLIDGEKIYQKNGFKVGVIAAIVGIILIVAFVKITKKITIKVSDDDETSFYQLQENGDESEQER